MYRECMTREELGESIKRERIRKGFSGAELADLVGCSKSNIFKVEEGHCPSLLLADSLLDALGVKLTIGRVGGRKKLELTAA
jgi:transcriptional regulator with XRE-family HTH domain